MAKIVSVYCILQEQDTLALRKEGLGVVLDSALPHLIGIDDDILSTGIMLFHLKVNIRIYYFPVQVCINEQLSQLRQPFGLFF